jgi:hypothetical protein
VRELEAALEQGTAHSEELQTALDSVQAALDHARSQSAKQASRLAHLESEFEALQEVMGEGEQRDIVGRLLGRISTLQAAAAAAEATRRQLHNQMVELRGNVSIGCPDAARAQAVHLYAGRPKGACAAVSCTVVKQCLCGCKCHLGHFCFGHITEFLMAGCAYVLADPRLLPCAAPPCKCCALPGGRHVTGAEPRWQGAQLCL